MMKSAGDFGVARLVNGLTVAIFLSLLLVLAVVAGQFRQAEVELVHANGYQMVDLSVLTRSVGVDGIWNALGRKVIVSSKNRFLILFVGSNRVALKGKVVRLSTSPSIVNGAMLVPVDFITKALNSIMDKKVSYEVVGDKVVIFDKRIGMTLPIAPGPPTYRENGQLQEDLIQERLATGATEAAVTNGSPLHFRDSALDVVVIDPGHGGRDAGDSGPTGLLEKEVTLKLAMRMKKLLERQMGIRVVLTRDADTDLSLERRTALANNEKADLFVSLHASGSLNRDLRGFRAFVANVEASDERTAKVVTEENKVISTEPGNETQKPEEYATMLWDLSDNDYFRESLAVAKELLAACSKAGIDVASVEPGRGSFIVLIGASMPAVLLEVGYPSNPTDEQLLKQDAYLDKLARAVCRGIAQVKDQVAAKSREKR